MRTTFTLLTNLVNKRNILSAAAVVAMAGSAFAQPCVNGDWIGITSTNPSDVTNYCNGNAPSAGTTIRIRSGAPFMPVYAGGQTYGGLTLQAGTSITLNGTVNFSGNIINAGGSILGTGTLRLIGGTGTTFSGTPLSVDIASVEIAKGGGNTVTLNSGLRIKNTIRLTDGELITNGNLTLVSEQGKTGRIGTITGSGVISGSVNVQRKIEGNLPGWYLVGATNTGLTSSAYSELEPRISPKNNASAFFHTENDTTSQIVNGALIERFGWKTMTANQAMPLGRGFRMYARDRFLRMAAPYSLAAR